MRCLWITRSDPTAENCGEFIYSSRLIQALAGAGADVTVLCLAPAKPMSRREPATDGIRWWRIDESPRPVWHSLLSPLPNIANRCAVPAFRRVLTELLQRERWQFVVLDSLSAGWALPYVLSNTANDGRRPYLIYVSHNHEQSTRARLADQFRGGRLKQAFLRADARKVAYLEQRVVEAAHLVTAISPADRALFAPARAGRPLAELPPGYDGRRLERRRITEDTPRRVIMVGSYDWIAKRENLREFASVAGPAFERTRTALTVVGNGGSFIDRLRAEFPSIEFTGQVDSIYPYMDESRMAVVPERLGGGFKLKTLDYVFNRLPIAALNRTFEGVPLVDRESVLSYPDIQAQVRGIASTIDDLRILNRLQECAYASCTDGFDWPSRGKVLFDAATSL